MSYVVTIVDRFVPTALRIQKKARRAWLGLLRPMRCPKCREFTRQKRGRATGFIRCLPCGTEFTKARARRQCRIDGARWACN
jgi:hypothetical protein